MKCIILVALVGLTACTVQPEYFKGPSGKDAYTMKCGVIGQDWKMCFKKSAELCPNGYNIISHSAEPFLPGGFWWSIRKMVIECK